MTTKFLIFSTFLYYYYHHHSVLWLSYGVSGHDGYNNKFYNACNTARGTGRKSVRELRSSSRSFPLVGFSGDDTRCPSVIPYSADMPWPGPLPSSGLFNQVCDLRLFSYPDVCFSVPGYDVYILFSILICTAASLFFAWLICVHLPRCMSLLEVSVSCRLVSSSRFQCYPWRCHGAWRMLYTRPWFFFESPCLGFCLWCCIAVPDRCSFRLSRSVCCWHILIWYVVFHHHICIRLVHLQTVIFIFIS